MPGSDGTPTRRLATQHLWLSGIVLAFSIPSMATAVFTDSRVVYAVGAPATVAAIANSVTFLRIRAVRPDIPYLGDALLMGSNESLAWSLEQSGRPSTTTLRWYRIGRILLWATLSAAIAVRVWGVVRLANRSTRR